MKKENITDLILVVLCIVALIGLGVAIVALVLLMFEIHLYLGWLVIGILLLLFSSVSIDMIVE